MAVPLSCSTAQLHCTSLAGLDAAAPQSGVHTFSPEAAFLLRYNQSAATHFGAPALQIKNEAELRGHSDGVTNVSWHPTHPDKLASIAGSEKSMRCVALAGTCQGSSSAAVAWCLGQQVSQVSGSRCCPDPLPCPAPAAP